jgi:ABC-type nitrate/sulfonate/bicarbonate transport system substrate-binding protein
MLRVPSLPSRLLCALAIVGALALGAAASARAAELRLAVARGTVSLPVYVAQARGLFAAEGLLPELVDCRSGRHCLELLSQQQVELATGAEFLVALDAGRSAGLTIVSTISASSQQLKVVGRRNAGIAVPADLRGLRIGAPAGTSAQYFLHAWLQHHGLQARDIVPVNLGVDRLVDGLVRQGVDAVAIWEPVASQALARLGADGVLLPSPRVYQQHFVLVAWRELSAQRAPELQRLLKALARAQRWIAERPDDAAQVLAEKLQITPAAARAAAAEHDYRLTLTPLLLQTMDQQLRWALREGLLGPAVRPGALQGAVDPGPLQRAVPGAVTLPGSS